MALVIGTLLFAIVLLALPLKMRVQAEKEMRGPLTVRVFLWPRRAPFVLEGVDLEPAALAGLFAHKGGRRPPQIERVRFVARLPRFLGLWRATGRIARRLFRTMTCYQWEWHVQLGTGEAATTGWLAGGAWLAQAVLQQNLARNARLQTVPSFFLRPSFTEGGLATKLDCVLGIRLVHLFLAALSLLAAVIRFLIRL
ncbi:MAG: DUF2953 domain-containing protein [Clostridia bacterium]|nr:DUF2953 domain-containing protein [Clostridia bacterium]